MKAVGDRHLLCRLRGIAVTTAARSARTAAGASAASARGVGGRGGASARRPAASNRSSNTSRGTGLVVWIVTRPCNPSATTYCSPSVSASTAFAAAGEYQAYLGRLARLQPAINAFFDQVMVMAEDVQLRNNRIALLSHLHHMMNRVADISKLVS